jgi:DNA polymerase-3 subunit epsilon
MINDPLIRERLRHLIRRDWTPGLGLGPKAILLLLDSLGTSPREIAEDLDVTPQHVNLVCRQIQDSPKVREYVNAWLDLYGLRPEVIWGTRGFLKIPQGNIPSVFGSLPVFAGELIPAFHDVVLLADCETSGPDADRHVAVEIALLKVVFDRRKQKTCKLLGVLDGYIGLQDPGPHPVNRISMRIHGIPPELLAGAALNQEDMDRVLVGATAVVAHNVSFDRRFMTKAVPGLLGLSWVCSYRGIAWKALGQESANLKALAKTYGLPIPNHRAWGDALALYHLLNQVLPDGETVLSQLISAYSSES